jgi:hypothetical protein
MATQDTANSSRTPCDIEMRDFMGGEDDNDVREEDIPQLTSVVAQCRFWWEFSKWPLVFLAANAIVIFSLLLDEPQNFPSEIHYYYPENNDEPAEVPWTRIHAKNKSILSVVLWLDAIAFYKAAKVVERQIIAMNGDSEVSSLSSLSHRYVYARVSTMVDTFLSSGRSGHNVSFFVNMLLLAFTIAMSASLVIVATALSISLDPGFAACLTGEVALPMINSGVPVELQKWASRGGGYGERNYIHLADGTTFFAGVDTKVGPGRFLSMAMANGTFKMYSNVNIGTGFQAIGHFDDHNDTSGIGHNFTSGMCLTYSPSSSPNDGLYPVEIDDGFHHEHDGGTRLLCYNSSDKMFRNTTMPSLDSKLKDRLEVQGMYSIQCLNDTVWLRAAFNDYRSGEAFIGIYNADYESMTWTTVVVPETSRHSNNCSRSTNYLHWLDMGVGMLAVIFSSFWLLKIQGLPAGVVPLTSFVIALLSSISWRLGFFSGLMGAIAAAASLGGRSLPARMNPEMVLWTLYTLLTSLVFPLEYMSFTLLFPWEYRYFTINQGVTATALLFLVVIGLVLNHPVLQVMGWVSAMWTVVITISSFVRPSSHEYFEIFVVIPIGIVMSCGLISAGYRLTQYRAYTVWYSRRLWLALNDLSFGRHRQDENLTQHLVSSRTHSA